MNPNIEIPQEIQDAALKVQHWFDVHGIKEWCLYGIQSRTIFAPGMVAMVPTDPIIFLRDKICPLCGAKSTSDTLPCSDCQWKAEKPTDCTCVDRKNPHHACPIHGFAPPVDRELSGYYEKLRLEQSQTCKHVYEEGSTVCTICGS